MKQIIRMKMKLNKRTLGMKGGQTSKVASRMKNLIPFALPENTIRESNRQIRINNIKIYREKVHLLAFLKRTVRAKQIIQALVGGCPPKSSISLKILTLKPRMRLLTAKPPKLALTNFSCLVSKTNITSDELRNRRLAKLLNTRRSQQ